MAKGINFNLDTTKSEFQNPMVELRQGDGNYQSLHVTVTSNGEPLDLNGWVITFMGTTNGLHKIVDSSAVVESATQGTFNYTPTKAWGQDMGEYKNAYFKFTKDDQAASSASFRVQVLEAVDLTEEEAGNYISVVDQMINNVKSEMDAKLLDTQTNLSDTKKQSEDTKKEAEEVQKNVDEAKKEIEDIDNKFGGIDSFKPINGNNFIERINSELYQRSVNVKWYGAVGDGSTDDTQAFKDAFTSTTGQVIVPEGTYLINDQIKITSDVSFENSKIISTNNAIDYMFAADGLDTINISGMKYNNDNGRGALKVTNTRVVRIKDFEKSGYSAETAYYKTDSALMLDNNEIIYLNDIYIHDNGFQYNADLAQLNRCISIQGDKTKTVIADGLTFNKANQGLIVSTPNANLIITNSSISNTKDNSMYLLACLTFMADNVRFDDYYDESVILTSGDYSFKNCWFSNVPNKVFGIAGNTIGLSIIGCNIIQSADYSGQIVSFRNTGYVLNTFVMKDNTIFSVPDSTSNDIFSFGQIDLYNISGNTIKIDSIASGRNLFAFRNNDTTKIYNGVIKDNIVASLQTTSVIGTYNFARFYKETGRNEIDNNQFSNGRMPSDNASVYMKNQGYAPNVGYATGSPTRQEFYGTTIPVAGRFKVGDIVYNTSPKDAYDTYAWVRITNGTNNILDTDWASVKISKISDNFSNYVYTRTATFTDLATVYNDMSTYQGKWFFYKGTLANSPIENYLIIEVVKANSANTGYIRLTGINSKTQKTAIVNGTTITWL